MLKKYLIKIKRGEKFEDFVIEEQENKTILEILFKLKEKDETLSFRAMCRSAICGTCGIKINDKPSLACKTKLKDLCCETVVLEPLTKNVIKDLVIDHDSYYENYRKYHIFNIERCNKVPISEKDIESIQTSKFCIECGLCVSSCPVIELDKNFGNPMIFTKLFGIINDKRDIFPENLIKSMEDEMSAIGLIKKTSSFDIFNF